jgi:hypothetical protein
VLDATVADAIVSVLPAAPLSAALNQLSERPVDVVAQVEAEIVDLGRMYADWLCSLRSGALSAIGLTVGSARLVQRPKPVRR